MGRTWDEPFFVDQGYRMVELVKKGDLKHKLWYEAPDPPPLAKFFFGLAEHLHPISSDTKGNLIFEYDFTFSRLISVLLSSLTVLLVVLIGSRYISFSAGVLAGIILAMLPFFLGFSQLATIESPLIFFFTGSTYFFLRFLEDFSYKNMVITGILVGLSILTKYTNILLLPLFLWIYFLWYFKVGKPLGKNLFQLKLICIFLIACLTAFTLWPMPWFHLKELFTYMYDLRVTTNKFPVPEVFFGHLMFTPLVYYLVYFLITTPLLLLFLFVIGLKNISNATSGKSGSKTKWVFLAIVVWFCLPFIQSFYNFRQHGIRYIIEIYAPFSLIAAIGFNYVARIVSKKLLVKILGLFFIFSYLLIIDLKITPYYLDYFNGLVGGTKGVYKKKLFQMGWWGQGLKESALFINEHAEPGSTVGLAVSPMHVVPPLTKMIVSQYYDSKIYDYVLVNYYNIVREKFNDRIIKRDYKRVYSVLADGAPLVDVYKRSYDSKKR